MFGLDFPFASCQSHSSKTNTKECEGAGLGDPRDYTSQQIGIDDFSIIKVVGRGSFVKVYLVRKKSDGKVYAMKTLKKDMVLRKNQLNNTKGKSSASARIHVCNFLTQWNE